MRKGTRGWPASTLSDVEGARDRGEDELAALIATVEDPNTSSSDLIATIAALSDLRRPEPLAAVVAHTDHPDPDVRFAVAAGLPAIAGTEWLAADHPAVVALLKLTTDADSSIRDWATFGLGSQLLVDGPEIRECLWARVDDPDVDTSEEAMAGLARRRDNRIIAHVERALADLDVSRLMIQVAACLGTSALAEPLARLTAQGPLDAEMLASARQRCHPAWLVTTATAIASLFDAAEAAGLAVTVATDLLDCECEPYVAVEGLWPRRYFFDRLLERAGGSPEAAIRCIRADLDEHGDAARHAR